jgi:hypothetical protein
MSVEQFADFASIVRIPPERSAEFAQDLQKSVEFLRRCDAVGHIPGKLFHLGSRLPRKPGRPKASDLLNLRTPPHHVRFWQVMEYLIGEIFALGGDPHVNRSTKGRRQYRAGKKGSRGGKGNLVDLIEALGPHLPPNFPKPIDLCRLQDICARYRRD